MQIHPVLRFRKERILGDGWYECRLLVAKVEVNEGRDELKAGSLQAKTVPLSLRLQCGCCVVTYARKTDSYVVLCVMIATAGPTCTPTSRTSIIALTSSTTSRKYAVR